MLRRIFKDLILVSIVMIVFGLVLLFWPEQSLTTAVRIIGAGLAISGLASVFAWVRERASSSYFSLAGAVLSCVAGVYLIARPEGVISFFPTVMGLAILCNGVINLLKALDLKKAGYGSWRLPCLMAAATIVLGLVIFNNPFGAVRTLVMLGGAALIYSGVSNIWIATRD